ncbi:anti-sigma factor [Neoroseomonas lacus]|uniref:Regulator of SigK n=1 Tax=Neoroseomonas lacus TaxID=287609 RepID=A0A917KB73_9PROT|nr:anti-sigma factor [Neoroseomonas lacus]GGJ03923.1 DNA-directed RNA polymerase sigma-70 factor [Neoroseomonas lacus]
MIPTDPVERDALAAEYVLGTLDARAARQVEQAMETDAALREMVAAWEARLSPLTALAVPEAPPPGLWGRIATTLDRPAAPAPAAARASPFWRFWALGASMVAAGLAALLLLRPVPEERLMTVLLTQRDQPAWLVEADGGALRLASLNPQPVPADRVMQLWALPQGATAPTSLGLIPAAQGRLTVTPSSIRPEPGMLIEISLEPPGGSPTGRPTGPVLFIGRLAAARGA